MHCAKEPTALILSLERCDYLRELPKTQQDLSTTMLARADIPSSSVSKYVAQDDPHGQVCQRPDQAWSIFCQSDRAAAWAAA
jgi:hypothetical protein